MADPYQKPAAAFAEGEAEGYETVRWNAAELRAAQQTGKHAAQERRGRAAQRAAPPLPTPESVIRRRRERIEQARTIRAFLLKLVVIAVLFYLLMTQVFGFAVMKGEQMYPRIRDGDLMLYYRLEDDYSIGDVLTFTRNGTRYTGRVVAKGGDSVNVDGVGLLQVNGNVQSEEIFYATTVDENQSVPFPLKLSQDAVFLLGDMRTTAVDSRQYGEVALDEIDGKIITILRRRGI